MHMHVKSRKKKLVLCQSVGLGGLPVGPKLAVRTVYEPSAVPGLPSNAHEPARAVFVHTDLAYIVDSERLIRCCLARDFGIRAPQGLSQLATLRSI